MEPLHKIPSIEEPPRVVSTFWKVTCVLVIIHSVLAWAYTFLSVMVLFESAMVGAKGYSFYYLIPFWLCLPISSLIAIIGFRNSRKGDKINKPLAVYIALQLFFILWVSWPYIYMSFSRIMYGEDFLASLIIPLARFILAVTMFSFPMLLLASRVAWIFVANPSPPTDAAGKLLNCSFCDYDLRGTRGRTCPECGASLMLHHTWKRRKHSIWKRLVS